MAQQRRVHGTSISRVSHTPENKRVLENLGDANLANRGVSLGNGKNGTLAGKTDSVYVNAVLDAAIDTDGAQVLTLSHGLGRLPAWANLWEMASTTGSATVQSYDKNSWTKTTIRVRVLKSSLSGALAGARMTLLVGG
jgi:hypothetical protein